MQVSFQSLMMQVRDISRVGSCAVRLSQYQLIHHTVRNANLTSRSIWLTQFKAASNTSGKSISHTLLVKTNHSPSTMRR